VASTPGSSGPIGADYARYAGVGCQFGATIVLFAAAGWWLDGKLGSSPWLLIVGVFTGFGGGLYALVKKVPGAGEDAHDPR